MPSMGRSSSTLFKGDSTGTSAWLLLPQLTSPECCKSQFDDVIFAPSIRLLQLSMLDVVGTWFNGVLLSICYLLFVPLLLFATFLTHSFLGCLNLIYSLLCIISFLFPTQLFTRLVSKVTICYARNLSRKISPIIGWWHPTLHLQIISIRPLNFRLVWRTVRVYFMCRLPEIFQNTSRTDFIIFPTHWVLPLVHSIFLGDNP